MASLPSRLLGAVQYVVRAEWRLPALLRARLTRKGDAPLKVSLRNVSRSGFMAMVPEPIHAGSLVTLQLPVGAPVEAEVRWAFNDRIGCSLKGRFDNRQLALLVAAGVVNAMLGATGLRAVVVTACIAMYLLT